MTLAMFLASQIVRFVTVPLREKYFDLSDYSWRLSYNIYLLFWLQVFQYKVINNSLN